EDNVSGVLFPLGDVAALSERLRRLIEAPQLRRQLGAAARARAEARFSQAQMAAAYEAVFAAVLREDGKQRTKEYAI
ncbi:MAG: glycosyltransferase, partial [Chloroflexota bacterium]